MNFLKLAFGLTFFAAVIYLGFDYAGNSTLPFLSFDKTDNTKNPTSLLEVFLSGGAMLAGLIFGTLYERLNKIAGQISIWGELKLLFTTAPFFRALLVSPLVFAGVYAISQKQPDLVVALILAFENGFFCEALFREKYAPR
jgi:hypothetical protein